ncbi:sensor histidine kinase [Clostridium tertium]|uniref:sensor histidine kinase n=1 Tax=Clostridium tertium TaxID=1559 RepID=UPI0024B34A27|nr:two-component regulator propeller domain-containing protein [Clostridium tertium]MDI9218377.1 ATP-binding protein [Clostridium tertium]
MKLTLLKCKLLIFILIITLISNLITIKVSAEILTREQFKSLSIDEGLSNEYVTTIFQDSMGYMWIGTVDGLNRYDGEFIKIYNCSYEDENTLSSTYIMGIEEDKYGNIWIATDHGLDFLIRDKDTIVRMKDLPEDKYNLGKLKITSLLKSSYNDNIMWVGTEYGLMQINLESNDIKAFYYDKNNEKSLTNSSITCLEEGEDGAVWVGTKYGVNIIDENLNIFVNKSKIHSDKLYIYNIDIDNLGRVWISTKDSTIMCDIKSEEIGVIWIVDFDGIKQYNIEEEEIKTVYSYSTDIGKINSNYFVMNDSKDNIWTASNNGIVMYSSERNNVDILRKNASVSSSLTSNVITCFYEDFNGTIWIGTDKGVNILNTNNQFNSMVEQMEIGDKNIVSILHHNDKIWVATKYNGIYVYDRLTSKLLHKLYEINNEISLRNQYIKSLFKVNDSDVLVATNKGVILIKTNELLAEFHLIEDGYSSELSYAYSDGKFLWGATTSNLYCYDINNGTTVYLMDKLIEFNIKPGSIKYILPDNKDKDILWLGGVDTGLIKYHKKNGVIEQYCNDCSHGNSLIDKYINCMAFDKEGKMWIGTNIGLIKFDIETNQITQYTTANGLTNNFINSILFDDDDNIWISTNKGLNKFDIEKESFTSFTKLDGLSGYQFNLNSGIKLESGFMIFGSTNGVVYFNPKDIVSPKGSNNKVVVGDMYIGKNKAIYDENELVLEYKNRDLYINYFLPNYERVNYITYEYMLEGVDSDWVYIGDTNDLYFKSLNPGKYTLKLRARDGHGKLTEETSLNIRVKKPIWKSPLAYLIYLTIIIAIAVYILNYVKILKKLVAEETMKLNMQLEENKRLSKEIIDKEKFKNNYFVNLSHELRTPINVIASTVQLINAINRDKSLTQERSNKYMNIINKSCGNLLKIINDIIDSSKIETGQYKINKTNNDIVYVVEEAALNMSKFIEEKGLSLIIDPDIEEKTISFDDTEIERCVINLLGNAVKFTPEGGEIRVFIKEVENNIEITVEDTGIGISKEDQEFIFQRFSQVEGTGATKASSSGIGLTLVKHIAELHGGYVKLESELNKGSRFTIGLPDVAENITCDNEDCHEMKL